MPDDIIEVAAKLKRIVEMPIIDLVSEEDVKIKVVLPILRAFGYEDNDFKYEGRTGRGYVDIVVEHYPTGIVIETKAPRSKIDNHRDQLETYVFNKHGQNRVTIAILTDGENFIVYGVTGALYRNCLKDYWIFSFRRADLVKQSLLANLLAIVGKQSNKSGSIGDAITKYKEERGERAVIVEKELQNLIAEREDINRRIQLLEAERTEIREVPDYTCDRPRTTLVNSNGYSREASPHILRLLREKGAFSESRGVQRKWLDDQLINKVNGVRNKQDVSFAIMELRDEKGLVDNEGGKNSKRPIGKVWLLESDDKSVS